jgi:lipopolysaccharide transport system permease protein
MTPYDEAESKIADQWLGLCEARRSGRPDGRRRLRCDNALREAGRTCAGRIERGNPLIKAIVAPAEHWRLLLRLARRDLEMRYRGSVFGALWVVLQPLIMLAVFTFLFSVVFPSRWAGAGTGSFALLLYAGLVVYGLFSEVVLRAPTLFLENASYVKKVVFPLEVLSWVSALVAAANALVGAALLLGFYLVLIGMPPTTALLAPVVIAPLIVLSAGLSFILASLGVFIRDLRQIVPVLSQALMFFGPILYPASALPEWVRPYLFLNPMTLIIEELRAILFDGRLPDWRALGVYTLAALAVLLVGYALFRRLRPAFADVM